MELVSLSLVVIPSNPSLTVKLERISAAGDLFSCRCSCVPIGYRSSSELQSGHKVRSLSYSGIRIRKNSKVGIVTYSSLERTGTEEFISSHDPFGSSISDLSSDTTRTAGGGIIHDRHHEVHSPESEWGGPSGGDGDGGGSGYGGGGDGYGEGSGGSEEEEELEYGPLLNAEQVQRELDVRDVKLPSDMLEAAKSTGIRELLLHRYFDLQQTASFPLGSVLVTNKVLRNRMLADPNFLFKVGAEIAIATSCATVAEVKKRGEHFWNEFELYASDMLVGIAFDIMLVGLMAPFITFGKPATVSGTSARISRFLQSLPSNMFEAQKPGRSFTPVQRVSSLVYKAVQYGIAGFGCGILGQGIASSVMTVKRKVNETRNGVARRDDEIEVPDVVKTAALWSVFMATSSNVRYQVLTGLESAVERSIIGKRMPQAALIFTVAARFTNNVFGAMQFVDWAWWAGVQ